MRDCPHLTEFKDIDEHVLKLGNGPTAGCWGREGIGPVCNPAGSDSTETTGVCAGM